MGRVLLCVGKKADKPYYMEKICRQVWSAEELCFLLIKNAYLLDESIMDKKLADWLEDECGLTELSRSMHSFIRSGCSLASFVSALLEEIGYCSREETQSVEQLLKNNAGLSGSEKQKVHADYLINNGRYEAALGEYEALLGSLDEEDPLRMKILHNMGVACAGQLRFANAAELFLEVYHKTHEEEEQECYLAALRMGMTADAYVQRVSEMPEHTACSLALEKELAQIKGQWLQSRTGQTWQEAVSCRREGRTADYYEKTEAAIAELKESYRENMA